MRERNGTQYFYSTPDALIEALLQVKAKYPNARLRKSQVGNLLIFDKDTETFRGVVDLHEAEVDWWN